MLTAFETSRENLLLGEFREQNRDLFRPDHRRLALHLTTVLGLLAANSAAIILSPWIALKLLLGPVSTALLFSLINVTIHHHHTHRNAARLPGARKFLDALYRLVLPNAPKRLNRYVRAHLNHHARPFHETDVDHHYGLARYARMRSPVARALYFLELSLVGSHVPGWEDDAYMNSVPLEQWNREEYAKVMRRERTRAAGLSLLQWTGFAVLAVVLPPLAWAWAYPMLLVKNWAHFLGQFQHHDERLLDAGRSVWKRTRTFRVPGWLNWLLAGEISGHFLHHIYPELPYYNIEEARRRFARRPELAEFVTY